MVKEFPGWLALPDAAKLCGLTYESLRRLVKDGVFTRGRFTSAVAAKTPIYLKVSELETFKAGGVDAVLAMREPVVPTHDIGGSD